MNDDRQLQFLLERLRSFGIPLKEMADGATSVVGDLSVSTAPFPTLGEPLVLERARFYTMGHKHLKFFQPGVLFDLPAVDVSSCRSAQDVESSLRRVWASVQQDLGAARERMGARGVELKLAVGGTRLRLPLSDDDDDEILAEVRSPTEIQLPSAGELAGLSLSAARERRFRPLEGLNPAELELSITAEMTRMARRARKAERAARVAERPALSLDVMDEPKDDHRVLVVANQGTLRDALISQLPPREIRPDVPRDPTRAVQAFQRRSYELVLIQAQMPRVDGFELAARMRSVPGVDKLPIVVIEERGRSSSREAAHAAGASAYLPGPFEWNEVVTSFAQMLDHASERRFSRFTCRLRVRAAAGNAEWDDLTETVGRGGLTLRTRREVEPGGFELYRIALPPPLGTIEVIGEVVSRMNLPGFASVLAGVRLRRFHDDGEARWIRMIEALANQDAQR